MVRTADAAFVSQNVADAQGDLTAPRYNVGDLVVHLPHGARLSTTLQERLGAKESRIRAGNFAGFRSEGMLMPVSEVKADAVDGDDVTTLMGVTF